jgi:hypothetical protein
MDITEQGTVSDVDILRVETGEIGKWRLRCEEQYQL